MEKVAVADLQVVKLFRQDLERVMQCWICRCCISKNNAECGSRQGEKAYLELLPDLTEAASDFSASGFARPANDPLGLSVLTPGILFRSAPLNDLLDSFVSALLKDGYD